MSRTLPAALLLAAAPIAACGGGGTASSAGTAARDSVAAATNPCDLLTPAQAGAVLQDGTLTAKSDTTVVQDAETTLAQQMMVHLS